MLVKEDYFKVYLTKAQVRIERQWPHLMKDRAFFEMIRNLK